MARLRKIYPFKPQRQAVAAKMWTQHLERYAMREWMRTEQEAMELSHYTNLQPLWAEDNLKKSNKYE